MTVHLVKLCVGVDSVEELRGWITHRVAETGEHGHTTRMTPKRAEELVDGGSLYWVIRGHIQARQRLLAVRAFRDGDGIGRCRLVLEPTLVDTQCQPRRAFQGWRYLAAKDAPPDLARGPTADLPPPLRRELLALGLL